MTLKKEDWIPADVTAAIRKKGTTLAQLSRNNGYKSLTTVNQALFKPWPKAEKIIADCLGLAPQDIWPSRYDERRPRRGLGGMPTHGLHHIENDNTLDTPRNVKNTAVD